MKNRESFENRKDSDNVISAPPGRPYESIVKFVEGFFKTHGDTYQGLGYPKPDGFDDRYRVFLDVIRFAPRMDEKSLLLDVGCGTGRLLDAIQASGRSDIQYRGVDLSSALLAAAKKKHPEADLVCGDPFDLDQIWMPPPDYVVFGGIFTCRLHMSQQEMTDYMLRLLRLAFNHCRRGIVFNVMSSHVDWERDDLFHVPFDHMAELLQSNLNRNYIFRADYGLYEYAVYVYK